MPDNTCDLFDLLEAIDLPISKSLSRRLCIQQALTVNGHRVDPCTAAFDTRLPHDLRIRNRSFIIPPRD